MKFNARATNLKTIGLFLPVTVLSFSCLARLDIVMCHGFAYSMRVPVKAQIAMTTICLTNNRWRHGFSNVY